MRQLFQTPATIDNISTRVDRTLKITISTQELPPEQAALIMSLHQKLGWFLFSENSIEVDDIPKEEATEFKDEKSPSRRLKDVIYIYWNKCTDKKLPFDIFWKQWINKKCDEIKDLLPKDL